jgi:transposase, IS5 family
MRPTEPDPKEPDDLFRARLSQQIDRRHPLVRLAGLIDWGVFEDRFGQLYHPQVGRPGIPIRLMVGLSYLQHTFGLSDEAVVARWVENPYSQAFCGFDYLQLKLPIDPSSLVRWRRRIGQDGVELLLQATIAAATQAEAVKEQSLERISVDTTVQPKAIAHPLDRASTIAAARSWFVRRNVTACRCVKATPGLASGRCAWPAATPTPAR